MHQRVCFPWLKENTRSREKKVEKLKGVSTCTELEEPWSIRKNKKEDLGYNFSSHACHRAGAFVPGEESVKLKVKSYGSILPHS